MNQFLRALSLISLAGASTFAVGHASMAEAYEALPAVACFTSQTEYPGDYVVVDTGVRNQSGGPFGRPRSLHCPVPNTGTLLTDLWVSGTDNNNEAYFDSNILVKTCSS